MQCQCDSCQPKCSSMWPSCLKKGEKLPQPKRVVQCYQVVEYPTSGGWAQGLQVVPPEQCQADAPAYMLETGQQLDNFARDPSFFNGPEREASCSQVPLCTMPVLGVDPWRLQQPLG